MTQMEDDPNGKQPKWKTTQNEKTTQMEEDSNGRQAKWKTSQMEDDSKGKDNV